MISEKHTLQHIGTDFCNENIKPFARGIYWRLDRPLQLSRNGVRKYYKHRIWTNKFLDNWKFLGQTWIFVPWQIRILSWHCLWLFCISRKKTVMNFKDLLYSIWYLPYSGILKITTWVWVFSLGLLVKQHWITPCIRRAAKALVSRNRNLKQLTRKSACG